MHSRILERSEYRGGYKCRECPLSIFVQFEMFWNFGKVGWFFKWWKIIKLVFGGPVLFFVLSVLFGGAVLERVTIGRGR